MKYIILALGFIGGIGLVWAFKVCALCFVLAFFVYSWISELIGCIKESRARAKFVPRILLLDGTELFLGMYVRITNPWHEDYGYSGYVDEWHSSDDLGVCVYLNMELRPNTWVRPSDLIPGAQAADAALFMRKGHE